MKNGNAFKRNTEREDKWQMQTFKRKAFPFLYNQGIITGTGPVPSNQEIQKHVMNYIRLNTLFDTPKHGSTNKNTTNLSELYKKLHAYIEGTS